MKTVTVYWMSDEKVQGKEKYLLSVLPKDRVEKAQRLIQRSDRALSLAAGYLVQRFVGEYYVDDFGKPRSEKKYFSLSHSGQYAAIVISSDNEVGLDVEKADSNKNTDALAKYCLDESEQKAYEQGESFLALFTAKESLSKAEGKGLVDAIRSIPALPLNGRTEFKGKVYYRHTLTMNGYYISVTLEKEDFILKTEEVGAD